MDSPAQILSQERVLVENLQRFLCRLTNGIIALNVYRIFLPLTVITSSVSIEHVGSLPSDCSVLLDLTSFFFSLVEKRSFLPMSHDRCSSLLSFCFQLQNLALIKVRIAFHCFPKSLCPFILFLFCECEVYFFIQLHKF